MISDSCAYGSMADTLKMIKTHISSSISIQTTLHLCDQYIQCTDFANFVIFAGISKSKKKRKKKIMEKVLTHGKNFSIILNISSLSPNLPKRFVAPGLPWMISFILIGDRLHLLLEPINGHRVERNAAYSVNLFTLNRVRCYTRDLMVDKVTSFISMDRLNQFKWADGTCSFEIQIKAAQHSSATAQQTSTGKLKLDEIKKGLDINFASGKFRLTVSELSGFNQARSPLFSLDNIRFGFTILKYPRKTGSVSLRVLLCHKDLKNRSLEMECKLISSHTGNVTTEKVDRPNIQSKNTCIDMIPWNELFTSPNRFIQNGSFVMEVDIKIGKNGRPRLEAAGESNSIQLECPICKEDLVGKPISSTPCGHMYCNACITRSLNMSAVCPLCKKPVSESNLHPMYLP